MEAQVEETTYTVTVVEKKIVGLSGKRAQRFWQVGETVCTSVSDLRRAMQAELERQMAAGE